MDEDRRESKYLCERYLRTFSDSLLLERPVMEIRGDGREYFVDEITRTSRAAAAAAAPAETFGRKLLGSPRLRQQPSLRRAARSRRSRAKLPLSLFSVRQRRNEMHSPALWPSIRYRSESSWTRETRRKVQRPVRSSGREKLDISYNYWRRLPEAV